MLPTFDVLLNMFSKIMLIFSKSGFEIGQVQVICLHKFYQNCVPKIQCVSTTLTMSDFSCMNHHHHVTIDVTARRIHFSELSENQDKQSSVESFALTKLSLFYKQS